MFSISFLELWNYVLSHKEVGVDISNESGVELIEAELLNRLVESHASIVHQHRHVLAFEFILQLLGQLLQTLISGQKFEVVLQHLVLNIVGALDLLTNLLQLVNSPAHEHNVESHLGEVSAEALAKAAACTSDKSPCGSIRVESIALLQVMAWT